MTMRISALRRAAAALAVTALTLTALPAQADPVKPPRLSAAAITSALNEDVSTPGTTWMTRPDGTVEVSYDPTVTGAKLTALTGVTRRLGDGVVLVKLPGKLTTRTSGGSPIWGGEVKCSAGFNVSRRGVYYLLTAGHCGLEATTWYTNSSKTARLGQRHHFSFPGNDYSLIIYRTDIPRPGGSVNLYNGRSQDISRAVNPNLGKYVYRAGATTGLQHGTVTGVNVTVNYPEGRVSGLIRSSVCSEPGDSGGPLFYRQYAYGLLSGGSGDCSSGGVSYFQPVVEALTRYGVAVY